MQNDVNVYASNRSYEIFPVRIVEILAAIYLVLEITNITRYFFFIRTGTMDRVISIGITMAILGIFILLNLGTTFRILRNAAVLFWFIMTLGLPIISLLIIPQECSFRDYVRLILFAQISMFGMILVYKKSYKMLGYIFFGIILLAFLNALLSKVAPYLFYGFAEAQFAASHGVFVSGENIVKDRATGLFNSNVLGCLLNASFIGFLCFYKGKTIFTYVAITLIVGFSDFLTGSRGAILFFFLICGMYFIYLSRNGQYLQSGKRISLSAYLGNLLVFGLMGIFVATLFSSSIFKEESISKITGEQTGVSRIVDFLLLKSDAQYMQDSRYERLKNAINKSQETIVIGKGVDPINIGHFGGGYYYDPHNEFARIILSYGWIYFIIFAIGIFILYRRSSRHKILDSIPMIGIFLAYFLCQCMTESKLLTWYHINLTLGVWIMLATMLSSTNLRIINK